MKKVLNNITKLVSIMLVTIALITPLSVDARESDFHESLEGTFIIAEPSGYEADVMDIFDEFMGDMFYIELVKPFDLDETYIYMLAPKDKEMAYVIQWAYEGNYEAVREWDRLIHELTSLSGDVHRISSHTNNNKYLLMMLNPSNYDNFVWVGFDDNVIYDYVYGVDDMDELSLELY